MSKIITGCMGRGGFMDEVAVGCDSQKWWSKLKGGGKIRRYKQRLSGGSLDPTEVE